MAEPTTDPGAGKNQLPTGSTQTNKLIEIIQAVLAGEKGRLNDLNLYVQERIMALDQARTSFLESVQSEGPEFGHTFKDVIEGVLASFEQVAVAQTEIALFLKDRQHIHLERGLEQLITGTNNMFAQVAIFESRVATSGPTNFPILNFFTNAVAALRSGQMKPDDFHYAVEGGRQFFAKAVEEIDNSNVKEAKGVPERREAFQSILQALDDMDRQCDEDLPGLDASLKLLEEGFGKLEAALKLYQQGQFMDTPTESPFVNWVIHAAEGVKARQYPVEILRDALDWLEKNVREARAEFEASAQVPVNSSILQDEIPRTLEAFDLHDEAIAQMRASLPNPSPEQLDAGIQALTRAVSRLKGSVDTYQLVAEREGKVVCPRCEALNLPGSKICTKCAAPMPQMADQGLMIGSSTTFEVREDAPAGASEGEEMVMTTHLKRLFDACEAVDQGQLSHEEFAEIVDWAEGLLEQGEGMMQQVTVPPVPPDLPEEEQESVEEQLHLVDETAHLLGQGIQEFRNGLESMRSYLDTGSRDNLVRGIRTVWEGAQKIYQVQRMGQAVEKMGSEGDATEGAPSHEDKLDLN